MIAAEAADGTEPKAEFVQSLAQRPARAHLDTGVVVVARLEASEDLGLGLGGLRALAAR